MQRLMDTPNWKITRRAGISKTEPGGAESRRSITISKYKYEYDYECEFEFQRGGEVIQNKRR